MEESKEKVRRVKKKYIDKKYPFKVNEVFLFCFLINPPSNCTKHTLTAHRNVERQGLCTEYANKNAVDANSEFTQQDGRKKRTAKRLHVTNLTGLLLACFVVIFT